MTAPFGKGTPGWIDPFGAFAVVPADAVRRIGVNVVALRIDGSIGYARGGRTW